MRRKDARALAAAAIAGLALMVLYGTFVLELAYYLVPGFKAARPDRVVFVWGAYTSILAGMGFEEIARSARRHRKFVWGLSAAGAIVALTMAASGVFVRCFPDRFLSGLGEVSSKWAYLGFFAVENSTTWSADAFTMAAVALLSVVLLALSTRWRFSGVLLFGVLVFEGGLMSARYLTFQQSWFPSGNESSIRFLQKHPGRIVRFGDAASVFPPNLPVVWDIPDAQGRAAVFLKSWGRYFDAVEKGSFRRAKKLTAITKVASLESELLGAAGVKYVIAAKPIRGINREMWKPVNSGGMLVYENKKVYPPAWIAPDARFVGTESEAVEVISEPGFAPLRTVVIEGGHVAHRGNGGVAKVEKSSGLMKVELEDNSGGWLVVSEAWYPAWRAEVDGQPRRVYKADVAFMAVKVNKGEKMVIFRYRNSAKTAGLVIALVGLVGSFALWLTMRK